MQIKYSSTNIVEKCARLACLNWIGCENLRFHVRIYKSARSNVWFRAFFFLLYFIQLWSMIVHDDIVRIEKDGFVNRIAILWTDVTNSKLKFLSRAATKLKIIMMQIKCKQKRQRNWNQNKSHLPASCTPKCKTMRTRTQFDSVHESATVSIRCNCLRLCACAMDFYLIFSRQFNKIRNLNYAFALCLLNNSINQRLNIHWYQ